MCLSKKAGFPLWLHLPLSLSLCLSLCCFACVCVWSCRVVYLPQGSMIYTFKTAVPKSRSYLRIQLWNGACRCIKCSISDPAVVFVVVADRYPHPTDMAARRHSALLWLKKSDLAIGNWSSVEIEPPLPTAPPRYLVCVLCHSKS